MEKNSQENVWYCKYTGDVIPIHFVNEPKICEIYA